jgi:hypothetical protein
MRRIQMLEVLLAIAATQADDNAITKYCMSKFEHWTDRAACGQQLRQIERELEVEALRKFLKENPHYRYPGMALPNGKIKPLDVCWGSDKTYGTSKERRC